MEKNCLSGWSIVPFIKETVLFDFKVDLSDDIEYMAEDIEEDDHYVCSWAMSKGKIRKTSEDRCFVQKIKVRGELYSLFVLMDGHRGNDVNRVIINSCGHHLAHLLDRSSESLDVEYVHDRFTKLFLLLNNEVEIKGLLGGSTLNIILYSHTTRSKYSANVGDAKTIGYKIREGDKEYFDHNPDIFSVMAKCSSLEKDSIKVLSEDHNATNKKELDSFLKENSGFVYSRQYIRKRSDLVLGGGINMTRSIGDVSIGTSSQPFVVKVDYDVISLMSDGLANVRHNVLYQKICQGHSSPEILEYGMEVSKEYDNSSFMLIHFK